MKSVVCFDKSLLIRRNASTHVWESHFAAVIGYQDFLGGFSYEKTNI